MNIKPWFQSKTLAVNGLVILAGIASQAIASLPPTSKTAVWLGVGVAAINAGLRLLTNSGVSLTTQQ